MEDLLECTITVPSAEQRITTSQIRFEFPQFVAVRPVGYDQIKLVGPKSAFEALYRKTASRGMDPEVEYSAIVTVPPSERNIAIAQLRYEFPEFSSVRSYGYKGTEIRLVGPQLAFLALLARLGN